MHLIQVGIFNFPSPHQGQVSFPLTLTKSGIKLIAMEALELSCLKRLMNHYNYWRKTFIAISLKNLADNKMNTKVPIFTENTPSPISQDGILSHSMLILELLWWGLGCKEGIYPSFNAIGNRVTFLWNP